LSLQDQYDNQKFTVGVQQVKPVNESFSRSNRTSVLQNNRPSSPPAEIGAMPPSHKSTMTLGEKKRLQWQMEKGLENFRIFSEGIKIYYLIKNFLILIVFLKFFIMQKIKSLSFFL
jgi:hypothetical protein